MRLADTWYVLHGNYGRKDSVLFSAPSLDVPLSVVGTITTKAATQRKAYMGYFSVAGGTPVPYQE